MRERDREKERVREIKKVRKTEIEKGGRDWKDEMNRKVRQPH